MRHGAVSISGLRSTGRWDADFHLVLARLKSREQELKVIMTVEEAISRLRVVDPKDKACLRIFGGRKHQVDTTIAYATVTYPFLALALVEENADKAVQQLLVQIAADQARLSAILNLTKPPEGLPEPVQAGPVMRSSQCAP